MAYACLCLLYPFVQFVSTNTRGLASLVTKVNSVPNLAGLCLGFGATSQDVAGLTSSKPFQRQQTSDDMVHGSIIPQHSHSPISPPGLSTS